MRRIHLIGILEPGDVVELSEAQATAMADRFEDVAAAAEVSS
jgi:hypothetical protein